MLKDLVGENNTWDLVFVDHLPMERRTTAVARLLKRTKLLIIHDTENFNFGNKMNLPTDFMWVTNVVLLFSLLSW